MGNLLFGFTLYIMHMYIYQGHERFSVLPRGRSAMLFHEPVSLVVTLLAEIRPLRRVRSHAQALAHASSVLGERLIARLNYTKLQSLSFFFKRGKYFNFMIKLTVLINKRIVRVKSHSAYFKGSYLQSNSILQINWNKSVCTSKLERLRPTVYVTEWR